MPCTAATSSTYTEAIAANIVDVNRPHQFITDRQSRWRASWTFVSICPFSHPEAGLQNSASNRKWLTIAEKRVDLALLASADLIDRGAHVV
jgi:hypothetical protein